MKICTNGFQCLRGKLDIGLLIFRFPQLGQQGESQQFEQDLIGLGQLLDARESEDIVAFPCIAQGDQQLSQVFCDGGGKSVQDGHAFAGQPHLGTVYHDPFRHQGLPESCDQLFIGLEVRGDDDSAGAWQFAFQHCYFIGGVVQGPYLLILEKILLRRGRFDFVHEVHEYRQWVCRPL